MITSKTRERHKNNNVEVKDNINLALLRQDKLNEIRNAGRKTRRKTKDESFAKLDNRE